MQTPELPDGWTLDPDVTTHDVERGIYWVILPDGTRTAWNAESIPCPVCQGDLAVMPDCSECKGRGAVDHVPYCERPWDLILRNGLGGELWLGGVHCQFGHPDAPGGNCFPGDRFQTVVSLYHDPGYDPAPGVHHYFYRITDADLNPDDHSALDELAAMIELELEGGKKVLVRCQAGINRSALVTGLTMLRLGTSVDRALDTMRSRRSPYVLMNRSFVAYLREVEARRG